MKDERKTRKQLSTELAKLRRRVAELEVTEAERARAEEALRESEKRFQLLFEEAPIAYQSLDGDGSLLEVNQAWLDLLGYSKQDAIGRWFGGLIVPEQQGHFRDCFAQFKATGEIRDAEFEMVREDGSRTIVSFDGTVGYDEQGNFRQTHCTLQDITERMRAGRSARVSARQWRATFDAIRDPVFLLGAGGKIIRCNRALVDLVGKPRSAIVGRQYWEVVRGERGPIEGCPYQRALETLERETAVWQLDGRWFKATVDPMLDEDGYLIGFVHIMEDITESKRAEEALRAAKERYRSLFEGTPIGLYRTTPDGQILEANPALATMLGFPDRDALLEANALDFYLDPEDRKRNLRVLGAADEWESVEARLRRRDDQIIWMSDTGRAIRDDEGLILYYDGALKDITERKRAEEALRLSEEQFSKAFHSGPLLMTISAIDDGTYFEVNENFIRVSGYSREDSIGTTSVDLGLISGEDREELKQTLLSKGKVDGMELTLRKKSGKTLYCLYFGELITIAGEQRLLSIAEDITGRKQAREALRESEAQKEAILNGLPVNVSFVNADLEILWTNRNAADSVNRSTEEMLGHKCHEFWADDPQEPCDGCPAMKTFKTKKAVQKTKTTPHGRVWDLRSEPVLDEAGGMVGAIEMAQDITDRKRAEVALRQRASQLALLNDIGSRIASVLDLEDVLDSAVRLVQESFGYHHVALFTRDDGREELVMRARAGEFARLFPPDHRLALGEGMVGWVGEHGETLLANDVDDEPRYVNLYPDQLPTQSELCAPIQVGDRIVGALDAQSPRPNAFDENDVLAMETLAHQIAVAIENARLYGMVRAGQEQLRDLASYLQGAREEERKRIAREIHDELGQTLTALKFDLSRLAKRLPEEEPALRERAEEMTSLIDRSMHTVRRVSTELRPGILDDLGLAAAIQWQAEEFGERTGIRCHLHLSEEDAGLEPDVATALFRILQETLTNVARHAEASAVRVELAIDPRQVVLRVHDDGRGITEREISSPQALGLVGIRERARNLGGEVTFEGLAGQGTTVTASIPRRET